MRVVVEDAREHGKREKAEDVRGHENAMVSTHLLAAFWIGFIIARVQPIGPCTFAFLRQIMIREGNAWGKTPPACAIAASRMNKIENSTRPAIFQNIVGCNYSRNYSVTTGQGMVKGVVCGSKQTRIIICIIYNMRIILVEKRKKLIVGKREKTHFS